MEIALYPNARTNTATAILSIESIAAEIRSGKYAAEIDKIRDGNGDKRDLPAYTFSSAALSRTKDSIPIWTGYVQIDLDDIEDAQGTRDSIATLEHVVFAFVSPRGKGVKVILDCTAHPTFDAAITDAHAYIARHGYTPDSAPTNVKSLCFVSCDTDAFYADFSVPLPVAKKSPPEDIAETPQFTPQFTPQPTPQNREYNWAQSIIRAECETLSRAQQGHRNNAANNAALRCYRVAMTGGISPETVTAALLTATRSCGLPDIEAQRTFRSAQKAAESQPPPQPIDRPNPRISTASATSSETPWTPTIQTGDPIIPEISPSKIYSMEDMRDEITDAPPPQLIKDILYQGDKAMFAAASKMGKTYLAMSLALCIAHGIPWIGFETACSPVLYVDLELQPWAAKKRIFTLSDALGITQPTDNFRYISGRGSIYSFAQLERDLEQALKEKPLKVLFVDPWYKLGQGSTDENNNRDVGIILNRFEELATKHSISTIFLHHFAKGNAHAKSSMDRASGAGVFARDVDTLLTFTEDEERKDCFVVESTLRNFPKLPKFIIRRKYPLFECTTLPIVQKKGSRPPRGVELRDYLAEHHIAEVTAENVEEIASSLKKSMRQIWSDYAHIIGT